MGQGTPRSLVGIQDDHKDSMGETPLVMAYRSESIIPVEIMKPSYRVKYYEEESNNRVLEENLDLQEERKEEAKKKKKYDRP